jgi:hypothetical protein
LRVLDYTNDDLQTVPWTRTAFLHVGRLRCGHFWLSRNGLEAGGGGGPGARRARRGGAAGWGHLGHPRKGPRPPPPPPRSQSRPPKADCPSRRTSRPRKPTTGTSAATRLPRDPPLRLDGPGGAHLN